MYIPDLPGTKKEVEEVYSLMNDMGMEADIFTDTLGTEASFKALSGKRRNTILIATHGFYGKNEPDNNTMPPMMILDNNRYVEDKAMTRSGLLFAGAANAWQIPDMANNGILTAQEVAGLDLRGLDMCVLSACETGMGEITGEGVYGLQRGFKKAGAKTLLVSLRKVYDDATRILMTEFYRNYLSGKSKIESLKAAQQLGKDSGSWKRSPAAGEEIPALELFSSNWGKNPAAGNAPQRLGKTSRRWKCCLAVGEVFQLTFHNLR